MAAQIKLKMSTCTARTQYLGLLNREVLPHSHLSHKVSLDQVGILGSDVGN